MNDGTTGVNPSATLERETDLYRFYDAGGRLLYVGISLSALKRAAEHRGDKDWWSDVARMDVTHYPTRTEAAAAERSAIIAEGPLHNVVHNGRCEREPEAAIEAPLWRAHPSPSSTSLVGWFFLTPDTEHGWPLACWQGHVSAKIGDAYMVQLYSWWSGEPTSAEMCPADDMADWKFFADERSWVAAGDRASDARDRMMDLEERRAARAGAK